MCFLPFAPVVHPDGAHPVGDVSGLPAIRMCADEVEGGDGDVPIDLGIEIAHPDIQRAKVKGRPHAFAYLFPITFPQHGAVREKHRKVSEVMASDRLHILRVNGRIVSHNGCAHIRRIIRQRQAASK